MANTRVNAIEVVDRETGDILARTEGGFAQRLYEASGLLQNLEPEERDGEIIVVFPIEPGTWNSPGFYNYVRVPNNVAGHMKEQLLLDLFQQKPIGVKPCDGHYEFFEDYRAIPHEFFTQILEYLGIHSLNNNISYEDEIYEWWTFSEQSFDERKQYMINVLVSDLDDYNDGYMRNLGRVGEAYNSNSNNVRPHPNSYRPKLSLTAVQNEALSILQSCELIRRLRIYGASWVHDLYLYIRREYGQPEKPVPYHIFEDFLKAFLIPRATAGGARKGKRRGTRRQKKRRGTRKSRRTH